MDLHILWAGLVVFALVLLAMATLTAALSGRQAMGEDVIRAVREDW